MTLGQFSVVVGAPPKWVQNTFRLLELPNDYSVSVARTMRLVRVIWETCGTEIPDAYRLAQEALERSVRGLEWQIESPDGSLAVVFDRDRFLSSFACALARARVLYSERRRGRPLTNVKHGLEAAHECGVDVAYLKAALPMTRADRLKRLDRDLAQRTQTAGGETRLIAMLEEVNREGIQYVLVGDTAAAIHGAKSEPTRLEICYDRRPENVSTLARWLASVNAYPRGVVEQLPFAMDSQTLMSSLSLPLITRLGAIDVVAMVKGVGAYDRVSELAVECEAGSTTVRVLGLSALLAAARFADRAIDRKRVVELEVIEELLAAGAAPPKRGSSGVAAAS